MDRALLIVALLCYLAPAVARDDGRLRVLAARWWVPAGVLVHINGLAMALFLDDVPLRSMTEGLGLTALVLVLARLWFGGRPRMAALRRILLGLSVLLLSIAAVAPAPGGAPMQLSPFFLVHIGLVLTGFAGLALTFSMSTLYLVVRRRLKAKRLADINRLPSLDALDSLILRTMLFGFVSLTAGMAVGFAWAATHEVQMRGGDFTTVLTVAVWFWYAIGLSARSLAGWRGRVSAIFGVGGFAAFMLITTVGLLVAGWHGSA
ncbi:cytochrome c biogenesis protein [Myxococcota bacterium]|nr:cytochrome c biogenesis protein [Myxococcota bacterium]